MINKIGVAVLILLIILGSFIFYGLFILNVDKEQQVQTTLDDSYYQVANLLDTNSTPLVNPNKYAYFGDLHIHTSNSFDASRSLVTSVLPFASGISLS